MNTLFFLMAMMLSIEIKYDLCIRINLFEGSCSSIDFKLMEGLRDYVKIYLKSSNKPLIIRRTRGFVLGSVIAAEFISDFKIQFTILHFQCNDDPGVT